MDHRQSKWRRILSGLISLTWVLMGDTKFVSSQTNTAIPSQTASPRLANEPSDQLRLLVARALNDSPVPSNQAVQELRRHGSAAVDYLMNQPELRKSPYWTTVTDAVAQQRDTQYSGLYWYTDLEEASRIARQQKKPILSLRLLGKLTDELSCANSRFFRTTLYPNPRVRDFLKSHFVLHWQTVRAVPIVTIDFGDGRQIRRTITGNSLHLVLDEQGRSVDVLPGLYSASMFLRTLQRSRMPAIELGQLEENEFRERRTAYHRAQLTELEQQWNTLLQASGLAEIPTLGTDHAPEIWKKLVLFAGIDPVLEGEAQRAVVERGPPAELAGRIALTKSISETPTMRLVRNVSWIIHEDSLRNEYHLHFLIHKWFATETSLLPSEVLVARVYSELFLSPLNDPWYGLSQPDVFSALKNDGRNNAVTQNSGR